MSALHYVKGTLRHKFGLWLNPNLDSTEECWCVDAKPHWLHWCYTQVQKHLGKGTKDLLTDTFIFIQSSVQLKEMGTSIYCGWVPVAFCQEERETISDKKNVVCNSQTWLESLCHLMRAQIMPLLSYVDTCPPPKSNGRWWSGHLTPLLCSFLV